MRTIYLDKAFPDVYKALIAMSKQAEAAAESAGLQPLLLELVKLRASQLNGCAYCLRKHSRIALSMGESPDRIAVLSVWRDTDYFTEAECAALAITEEITLIADVTSGRRPADVDHPELTDAQVAAVRWLAIAINAFNRVSITSHHPVDPDAPPAPAGVPAAAPAPAPAPVASEAPAPVVPAPAASDAEPPAARDIVEELSEFDAADNRDS